jgi:hypothetical protein
MYAFYTLAVNTLCPRCRHLPPSTLRCSTPAALRPPWPLPLLLRLTSLVPLPEPLLMILHVISAFRHKPYITLALHTSRFQNSLALHYVKLAMLYTIKLRQKKRKGRPSQLTKEEVEKIIFWVCESKIHQRTP